MNNQCLTTTIFVSQSKFVVKKIKNSHVAQTQNEIKDKENLDEISFNN